MFSDEVQTIHSTLGLVYSLNQTIDPDGEATVVRVGVGHGGSMFGTIIKTVFNLLDFLHEEFVDDLSGFGHDVVFYSWSSGKLVEVLEHLDSILNGADVFEGEGDLDGVEDFDLLNFLLENLTIVVVPLGDFNIEVIVIEVFDLIQVLVEWLLQILKREGPLFALGTTEHWHSAVGSTKRKLKLAFTNFFEVFTALNECFILSEDLVFRNVVAFLARVVFDHVLGLSADIFPVTAAFYAFIKVLHALFNIVAKHVILVDLCAAPLDDQVWNFGQQTLHALCGIVVSTQLPDNAHAVQHFG